jgi:serine/threonine protein kinase
VKPGTLVGGKYRLLREVGKGAMGTIWATQDELTGRQYALKILSGAQAPSDEARERFLREAEACGRLLDPNIIELYDVGFDDHGQPFLVLQLLQGETLGAALGRVGRFSSNTTAHIAFGIANAMRAAHDIGVVHRDLKPENIFLHQSDESGTVVKVLDFGLSKVLAVKGRLVTIEGERIGSPAYMSPEQALGELGVDQRADIWSFGVIVFEMLAGHGPFVGSNPYLVVARMVQGNVTDLREAAPQASAPLVELVSRCLQRDPACRLKSAREALALLRPLIRTRSGIPGYEPP